MKPSAVAKYVADNVVALQKNGGYETADPASIYNAIMLRVQESQQLFAIAQTEEGLLSIVSATQKAYALRLSMALDQWAMVPYARKAQFQLQKEGWRTLAFRTKWVKSITEREVYEGDIFEWDYTYNRVIKHEPTDESEEYYGDYSKVKRFYCVIELTTGGFIGMCLTKKQVEKHRDRFSKMFARNPEKSQWNDDQNPIPMGNKTLLIMTCKKVPRGESYEFATAVAIHDRQEAGKEIVSEDAEYVEVTEEEHRPQVEQPVSQSAFTPKDPPVNPVESKPVTPASKPLTGAVVSKKDKPGDSEELPYK